ncbi:Retrovirus-related Pol polyprotein from transposon TNT 1-94, partial [Pseudolycoriella hygida]
MEHEGLWPCITGDVDEPDKLLKAKSKLILLINPLNYGHIQVCTSAKEIWEKLQTTFEDSGLTRRVGLIRTLATTKLSDCANMEAYVQLLMGAAHKLNGIKCHVSDDWIATFLLAGLPDSYQPMIMALENSGIRLSADAIKTKLLQEYNSSNKSDSSKAFFSSKKQANKKTKSKNSTAPSTTQVQCYSCKQYGHKSFECSVSKKKQHDVSSSFVDKSKFGAFVVSYPGVSNENDWFIDSAASFHMSLRDDWMVNKNPKPIDHIVTANNSSMQVQCSGQVIVDVDRKGVDCELCKKGHKVIFTDEGCEIFDRDLDLVATGRHVNNMFVLNRTYNRCLLTQDSKQCLLWHRRTVHLNFQDLCKMKSVVNGMEFTSPKTVEPCIECLKGKQSRFPFLSA